jgi:hypothetical protein
VFALYKTIEPRIMINTLFKIIYTQYKYITIYKDTFYPTILINENVELLINIIGSSFKNI